MLPRMDAPALVRFLWACSKYRLDVAKLGVRLRQGGHGHEADGASGAGMVVVWAGDSSTPAEWAAAAPPNTDCSSGQGAPLADGTSSHNNSSPRSAPPATLAPPAATLSLLDFSLARLQRDLHFAHLSPALVAQLLSAVAMCGAQPDPHLMDACLLALLQQPRPQHPSPATLPPGALSSRPQSARFSQPAATGVLALLSALDR